MANDSGLHQASQANTTQDPKGYCGRCGNPKCVCGPGKPSEASVAMPGDKNTLEAAFGPVADEHGSSMFKGLR